MHDDSSLDQLLERFSRGEAAAFEPLYEATAPRLLGVAYRMLRNRASAEEVVQELYLKLWKHPERFDSLRGRAWSWLIVITRRQCLDLLRRTRPETPYESEEGLEELLGPEDRVRENSLLDRVTAAEDARHLKQCLDGLSADHREAILLSYWNGWTVDETARHLGRPLGTVKSWIRRGLQNLKQCLGLKSQYAAP